MGCAKVKRFVFIGGIPTFDYMINVDWAEIARAVGDRVFVLDSKMLLPVGTVFKVEVPTLNAGFYINPMANVGVQFLRDAPYFAMEFGGKHPEQFPFSLKGSLEEMLPELNSAYPDKISSLDDLNVVEVGRPVEVVMGGNNRNLLDEISTLFTSPELSGPVVGVTFEHHFFIDADNPKFDMVRRDYAAKNVSLGEPEDYHVEGLIPRTGYVLTIADAEGKALDRIILSNRTNEKSIPLNKISARYLALENSFKPVEGVEIHLVINSMTNPDEMRFIPRLLQTSFARRVTTYLCPTATTIRCIDRMLEDKYYTTEKERYFDYRKDFFYTSILPYIQYLVLNRDELALVDNVVHKKGIDDTASVIAHRMNRGKHGDCVEGGKVIVTGGSKGARFTERLSPERAVVFWQKAHLTNTLGISYAVRRLVCGDDYVTGLVSTLGAGDVFTGIFISLSALGWDGGHALRAATLGAQHFIQTRVKPRIGDMIEIDENHIRMGTETEMVDVVNHHVDLAGDNTRYGTIANTLVTIRTAQIHHPFRETLKLALTMAEGVCENGG